MAPRLIRSLPRSLSHVASRVVSRAALLSPLAVWPALAQAQVGHAPTKSPYEDYAIGQTLTITAGRLSVGRDPANVAPKSGPLAAIRYDVRVGGPASFFARYTVAPSTRDELDPTKPRATRIIASPGVTTHLTDVGLNFDLTGKKTYRRLLPSAFAGVGVVTDFGAVDSSGYQFGTNFAISYGFALRYVTRRGPQLRLDFSRYLWQYQYPDRYFVVASDTTAVLRNTRQRSAWRDNWSAAVGLSVPIFR
jgi:hypothetical protein